MVPVVRARRPCASWGLLHLCVSQDKALLAIHGNMIVQRFDLPTEVVVGSEGMEIPFLEAIPIVVKNNCFKIGETLRNEARSVETEILLTSSQRDS